MLDLRVARQKGAYKSYGPHASPCSFQIFKYAKVKQHEHKIVKYYKHQNTMKTHENTIKNR